jgi:hypothetical protein
MLTGIEARLGFRWSKILLDGVILMWLGNGKKLVVEATGFRTSKPTDELRYGPRNRNRTS